MTELRSLIGDDELDRRQEFGDVDVALTGLMNRLDQKLKPRGLVILIDDLNKSREGYPVALEFLSYLQVFTYEMGGERLLSRTLGSTSPAHSSWEPTVRTQPRILVHSGYVRNHPRHNGGGSLDDAQQETGGLLSQPGTEA